MRYCRKSIVQGGLLLIAFMCTLLCGAFAHAAQVQVSPAAPQAVVGDTLTLSVQTDQVAGLGGFQFGFTFNPAQLSVSAVRIAGSFDTTVIQQFDNAAGSGMVSAMVVSLPSVSGGPAPLATIDFTAKAGGIANIALTNVILGKIGGEEIPSTAAGATITITVIGQTDFTPPATTAAPAGGVYNSAQSVTLSCLDTGGSGCANTYYCIGAACSPVTTYSGAIDVASSTILRFYSTDNAGNAELTSAVTYTIDTTPPALMLSALGDGSSTNDPTMNIAGSVSDASGVTSVIISRGTATPHTVVLATVDNINYTFNAPVSLATGTNVITLTATDMVSNATTTTRTIYLDQTAPALAIIAPADNSVTNMITTSVTGTVGEAVQSVLVSLGTNTVSAMIAGNLFTSPTVTLTYGMNTINVLATDLAGNTASAKRTVTYDNQIPAVAITGPAQDIRTNQGVVTVSGTVNDLTATSVLASCPTASVGVVSYPTATTWQVDISNMTEGINTVTVTATDAANNTATAIRNIIYDVTPPTVTVNPVSTPTNIGNRTISGTSEANATVAVTSATAVVGPVRYPTPTSWQADITLATEGTNTFTITAADSSGNLSSPLSVSIVYDTAAPATTASPSGGSYNAAINVTLTSSEPATIFYTTDGSTPTYPPTGMTLSGASPVTIPVAASGTLRFFGRDGAGNSEAVRTAAYTIVILDTTPPVLAVSTLANNSRTNNGTLNISGTVNDEGGIQSLIISSQSVTVTQGTFNYALTLADGPNTVVVAATDMAGNVATDTRTIILDQSAPALSIITPADNSATNQVVATVTGTVDETATVSVALNNGNSQAAIMAGNSFTSAVNLASGMNTIDITARDLAGNTSSGKRTVIYDAVAPNVAISSPGHDITVAKPDITVSGTVTDSLTPASTTMTVDGTVSFLTLTAGAFSRNVTFAAEGSHAVIVTATDQAGNSAAAQRNIIYAKLGDVNDDNDVTIVDALLAFKHTLDIQPITDPAYLKRCDVAPLGQDGRPNPDGKVDIGDVVIILRHAVGLVNW